MTLAGVARVVAAWVVVELVGNKAADAREGGVGLVVAAETVVAAARVGDARETEVVARVVRMVAGAEAMAVVKDGLLWQ